MPSTTLPLSMPALVVSAFLVSLGRQDFFNLCARGGGEMGLSDQADDPMAFIEPGKGRLNRDQLEEQDCRE